MSAVPQTAMAQSTEKVISCKQANKLNEIFLDACEAFTYKEYIEAMPYNSTSSNRGEREVTVYMGRQVGDVIYTNKLDDRSNKILQTANDQALSEICRLFKVTYRDAIKYLALNDDGYFNDHKNDTIAEHWARRVGLDLEFLINELKENENHVEV